jgi:sRNA-binding regulator protein Hfq
MGKLTQIIKINEALQKGDRETAIKLLKDLKKRAKDPAAIKFAEDKLRELGIRNEEVGGGAVMREYEKVEIKPKSKPPGRPHALRNPSFSDRRMGVQETTGVRTQKPELRSYPSPTRKSFTQKPKTGREALKSPVEEGKKAAVRSSFPHSVALKSPSTSTGPVQKKLFKKKQKFKRKSKLLTPEERARKEAARNLVNTYKISFTGAYQIVDGKLTLEEYQARQAELAAKRAAWQEQRRKREERKAAALALAEKYNLDPSITYQIVDGRFTLEEYLKLRELKPKKLLLRRRKEGVGSWYFQQLLQYQTPLVFVLYNGQSLVSPITEIQKYDFRLGEQIIPKLHITHCYQASQADKIKELIPVNEEVKTKGLVPAIKPIDRYLIPDKDLERCREEKNLVTFTTLGGEVIRGVIEWLDSFQIKVNLQENIGVVVFRHGIHDAILQPEVGEVSGQVSPQLEKTPVEIPIEKISVELAIHQNTRLNPEITQKVREQTKTLGKIPKPIWVAYDKERDVYVLLDGFRRLTIAQELGLKTLPAVVE